MKEMSTVYRGIPYMNLMNNHAQIHLHLRNINEVTAQLKRPDIGQDTSCASELLHFETLPS